MKTTVRLTPTVRTPTRKNWPATTDDRTAIRTIPVTAAGVAPASCAQGRSPVADERREEDGQDRIQRDQEGGVRGARPRERGEEEPGVEHAAAHDHPEEGTRRGAEAVHRALTEREREEDRRGERVAPRRDRE